MADAKLQTLDTGKLSRGSQRVPGKRDSSCLVSSALTEPTDRKLCIEDQETGAKIPSDQGIPSWLLLLRVNDCCPGSVFVAGPRRVPGGDISSRSREECPRGQSQEVHLFSTSPPHLWKKIEIKKTKLDPKAMFHTTSLSKKEVKYNRFPSEELFQEKRRNSPKNKPGFSISGCDSSFDNEYPFTTTRKDTTTPKCLGEPEEKNSKSKGHLDSKRFHQDSLSPPPKRMPSYSKLDSSINLKQSMEPRVSLKDHTITLRSFKSEYFRTGTIFFSALFLYFRPNS